MLERMRDKRQRGYRAMRYRIDTTQEHFVEARPS